MKRLRVVLTAALLMISVLLVGCQNKTKEKLAFRETGISQMDAGDYEAAIQSFGQALEASDGLVGEFELDVLKYRAEAEMCVGDYAAAAHTYDVLCQVDGEKVEYLNRSCIMHVMDGQLDTALERYTKAYALESDGEEFTQAFLLLGEKLEDAGRQSEAMEIYQTAVNDGVQSGELYNRMALCELEEGDYDQALQFLTAGLQIGDEGARAKLLYNQAVVYEKKLDFASALTALEKYAAEFGAPPEVEKELAFLRTR